jgi:hypothetical protein
MFRKIDYGHARASRIVKNVVSLNKLRNDYHATRPVEKDQIRSVEKDQTRPVETDQIRLVPLIVVEPPTPSTVGQPPPVRKNLSTLPPFRQPLPQADVYPGHVATRDCCSRRRNL